MSGQVIDRIDLLAHTRDGSACTTLKKVPGPNGKMVDKWIKFYVKSEGENEFYLRNRQVYKYPI